MISRPFRRALAALPLALFAAPAMAAPDIAEPMVFDLVRPLGAKKGEAEVNTLVQRNLSGPDRMVEWAPEIEMAVADGFAVELELPLEDRQVTDFKIGLQGTFGLLNGGRGIHGVQYLGQWNREHGRWESSLLYVLGNRFSDRVSTISMVGIGDVAFTDGARPSLLVNHTTFVDLAEETVVGLEINLRRGRENAILLMPQVQQALGSHTELQAGFGASHESGDAWRPRVAFRIVQQL